ncbi:hypothetical protein SALBM135S_01264 [Streptomyces alboniger]
MTAAISCRMNPVSRALFSASGTPWKRSRRVSAAGPAAGAAPPCGSAQCRTRSKG